MHALSVIARRRIAAASLAVAVAAAVVAATSPDPLAPASARVALVPLDDRPTSLLDPVRAGAVADAEVITPPRIALGRYFKTGDGDAIARWLDALDLTGLDAVVVSTDMLAYGGLMGSRVPRVFEADARRRLESLARLKQRRADLRVHAFSTIPGAAPAGGTDQTWRQARARNRSINASLIDLASRGAVDHLAFAEDDPAPAGEPVADREAIVHAIQAAGAGDRVMLQPGADPVATLLLARALAARFKYQPAVQVTYSSPGPQEVSVGSRRDSLSAIVVGQIALAGARQAARGGLQLFVYSSRRETPDHADAFAARVAAAVAAGARVVVADIDPAGQDTGASLPFTEGLRSRKATSRLCGYGASGGPAMAIGTALSHGLLCALAIDALAPSLPLAGKTRIATAQVGYLLHRLVTDFLYHGVVRGQVAEDFVGARGLDPQRLDDSARARVEKQLLTELKPLAESLTADFASQTWRLPAPQGRRSAAGVTVKDIEGFQVSLPWGRMSEADIGFTLNALPASAAPRPPGPRVLQ